MREQSIRWFVLCCGLAGRSAEADRRLHQEVGDPVEGEGEGPAQDLGW